MKKAAIFCLVIALLLSGCSIHKKTSKVTSPVKISVPGATSTEYIMGGKIATDNSINVVSNVSGKVSEVSVDFGKKVNSGDVVVKLDTKALQSELDQAQSEVSTTQTQLSSLQNITSNLNNTLKSQNTSSAGTDTGSTGDSSGALGVLISPDSSDVSTYESKLAQAQTEVKTLQAYIDASTVTAPISGTVTSRDVNVGDTVEAGQSLISMVNTDNLYVNAYAPARVLNQIKVGQGVVVKVPDVSDDEFTGKIAVINSKLDSKSSDVLVKVTIDKKNQLFKPGMFAEIGLK